MRQVEVSQTGRNLSLYLILFGISAVAIIINIVFIAQVGHYLWSNTSELAEEFGESDQGFYLRLALDLQDLNINPENYWVLALWPPGTPVSFAVLDILPGPLLPYLIVTIAFFWAIPPYLLITSSPKSQTLFVASLALWTLNPIFHNWIFGSGIFYSESLGIPVFAAALALLLRSFMTPNPQRALFFSAVLLGASLYFRATLVPITLLAFLSVAAVVAVSFGSSAFRQAPKLGLRQYVGRLKPLMAGYTRYAFVVLMVAAPWAIIVFTLVNPGSISWSANEYLWVQKWTTSEDLRAQGAGFLVEGGANWPCVLNAIECSVLSNSGLTRSDFNIAQNAALNTLYSNFGAFVGLRIENLLNAFISWPGSGIGSNQTPLTLVSYVALFSTYVLASLKRTKLDFETRLGLDSVFFVALAVTFASFIIMAVYHIETRYFLPSHVVSIIASGFFLAVILKDRRT